MGAAAASTAGACCHRVMHPLFACSHQGLMVVGVLVRRWIRIRVLSLELRLSHLELWMVVSWYRT